jgi:hypothetical protein
MVADISNAYLTAPTTERVWTVLGPKWGADAGVNKPSLFVLSMASSLPAPHTATTWLRTYDP